MAWTPWLGAIPDRTSRRTGFRVWAPRAASLEVHVVGGKGAGETRAALKADGEGYWSATLDGVGVGARYFYRFADGSERPDPASLLQPEGVHGPSEVVDLAAIKPKRNAPGLGLEKLVFCEIHLGTYTKEGTADAAAGHLHELVDAGYSAVEVMPVASFPGARNWGYDGVQPFAVLAAYGGPAGLARLIDAAHERGLAAFLDVVYNHLGPEGNYLGQFGPYFTARHKTPWGDALNYDGPDAGPVRRFFIENALRWVASAGGGFDGLRLDAVHGIVDTSPEQGRIHFLRELNEAVQQEARERGRTIHVIAESDLNERKLVESAGSGTSGGYGLAAAWADDFHHALHAALTGEKSGYYADYAPPHAEPVEALATTLREGWLFSGQHSALRGRPHGTPAGHLPGRAFVVAAQNHDQIGNRAAGDRLASLTSLGGQRVATALVALQPSLPLFFQGDDWGAKEPFLYFVSHGDEGLVEAVRRGRREEFAAFASFGDEVPDPASDATFERSKLDREARAAPPGQASLRWHRALLGLRREHPALQDDRREALEVRALQASGVRGLVLVRRSAGRELALVCALDEGQATFADALPTSGFRVLLDSAATGFGPAADSRAAQLDGRSVALCGRQAVVLEK